MLEKTKLRERERTEVRERAREGEGEGELGFFQKTVRFDPQYIYNN